MLSETRWSCPGALAVTQTALFLWCEINTSSQLIKAHEILQSSLGVSGLSFLTQILSPLPDCHGQSCWATVRIQRKLPPIRWQFQVRQSATATGLSAYFQMWVTDYNDTYSLESKALFKHKLTLYFVCGDTASVDLPVNYSLTVVAWLMCLSSNSFINVKCSSR